MLRRVTPALMAWALLGASGALAQVPAPVAPPGTPGAAVGGPPGPPGPPPAIPVRQPPVAVPGVPQASPAAIPANLPARPPGMPVPAAIPGAPSPPGAPGVPGLPDQVGAAINAVLAPAPPPPKREPKENEVELTRADYRQRLVTCLQFRADCSVRGLSHADQDYLRYELKGQRLGGMMLDEVVDARMLQFNNDITVIVPKKSGSPDWHGEMVRGARGAAAGTPNFAMSNTEAQRESGGNVRTRYIPWAKQNVSDREAGARRRTDLD